MRYSKHSYNSDLIILISTLINADVYLEFLQDKDNDTQTAVHSLQYNLYDMERTLDV